MNTIATTKAAKLKKDKYTLLILSIHEADASIDASDHVLQDVEAPEDPAELKIHNTKQAIPVGAPIEFIPLEITDIIFGRNQRPILYQIITILSNYIDTAKDRDHRTLKAMAESTKYTGGSTVDEYLAAHESIRAKMLTVCYLVI